MKLIPFRITLRGVAGVLALGASAFAAHGQSTQILPSITTVAGNHSSGKSGDGGAAISAKLSNTVNSATMDPYGNIFIADTKNAVIRRVDAATGIIDIYAGGGTVCAGATDTAGDGCPALQAVFQNPVHVRWFRGDLYVVDSSDNRVRKISGSTGIITCVLGTGVSASVTYGKGPQTIVRAPQAVAFNSRGDMFVTQNGGAPRVDRVDGSTGDVTSFAGTGVGGKSGDGGISTSAMLNTPIGIAVDSHDNVYVAEKASDDIRKITVTDATAPSGTISTWAGPQGNTVASGFAGDGSTADNALFSTTLSQISFDGNDNLYVADSGNFRVRKITQPAAGQSFGIITTVAGNGTSTGTTGNDGQYAQNGILVSPTDAQVTPAGDLLITDKGLSAIRMVRPASVFPSANVGSSAAAQTIWAQTSGTGTFTIPGTTDFTVGATSCAASAVISGNVCSASVTMKPTLSGLRSAGIVFTDSSSVAVSQAATGTGIAPAASVLPGTISLSAGSATAATGSSGDGAAATSALLNKPGAVAVDAQGNAYVADTLNHTVRKIALGGTITRVAGTAGVSGNSGDGAAATSAKLNAPASVAVDGAGNLYIADTGNSTIRRVDASTGVITTIAGTGVAGYTGDLGPGASATLNHPAGVAFSSAGVLYIADTGNNVVRELGMRAGAIQTVAGGDMGSGGDGGPALSAQLHGPAAVAVGANGTVYIADTGNHRIRAIDSSGKIRTVAGVGVAGFNGDGDVSIASVSSPAGVAVDAAGNLYIADTGNNRVRVLANGQLTTIAGANKADVGGNGGNSSLALLNAPAGIALDATNNLFIADTGNSEIRRIDASGSSMAFAPTTPTLSSASQLVSIINAGNANLSVTSLTIPSGFAQDSTGGVDCNATPLTLAAGKACALSIHFAPAALVSYSGSAVVTDNSQSVTGATQSVALSGLGKNVFTFSFTLPATVTAGSTQSITVKVTNPVQTYLGTVTFTSSDSQAALPSAYKFTSADNGTHTFTGIKLGTVGIQTVTAADQADPAQAGTQSTTVSAGAATAVVMNSGSPQSATIGSSYGSPLVARVVDAYGNPVQGVTVTFTAPSAGARANFNGTTTTTAVSNVIGVASTSGTALNANFIIGTFNVVASASGLTPATFALTNTSTIPADFTLSSSLPAIATVLPGASASVAITVTPVGGFYAPIALTCSSPEPSITCAFSNATIAAADGIQQTTTFTVTTVGPGRTNTASTRTLPSIVLAFVLFAGCTLRGSRKLHRLAVLIALAIGVGTLGCGDGTLYQGKRTPAGMYNITVTGTSGSTTHTLILPTAVAGD